MSLHGFTMFYEKYLSLPALFCKVECLQVIHLYRGKEKKCCVCFLQSVHHSDRHSHFSVLFSSFFQTEKLPTSLYLWLPFVALRIPFKLQQYNCRVMNLHNGVKDLYNGIKQFHFSDPFPGKFNAEFNFCTLHQYCSHIYHNL